MTPILDPRGQALRFLFSLAGLIAVGCSNKAPAARDAGGRDLPDDRGPTADAGVEASERPDADADATGSDARDATAPALLPLADFAASVSGATVTLTWRLPAAGTGVAAEIRRLDREGAATIDLGQRVYRGAQLSVAETLPVGIYYYAGFALDAAGAVSAPVTLRVGVGSEPAGTLDPTFGPGGVSWLGGSAARPSTESRAIVELAGGVVVAGAASVIVEQFERDLVPAAWRLGGDGIAVSAFGVDGLWLNDPEPSRDTEAVSVAVGPDGNIYVGGRSSSFTASQPSLRVWRLSALGRLDGGYGVGAAGYAENTLGDIQHLGPTGPETQHGPWVSVANDLRFDAAGRLLVAGPMNGLQLQTAAWYRFTAAGLLDPSFNTDGVAYHFSGWPSPIPDRLLQSGDGSVYLVGYAGDNGWGYVWKFAADGTLIQSYGDHPATETRQLGAAVLQSPDLPRLGVALHDGYLDGQDRVTAVGSSLPLTFPDPVRAPQLTLVRVTAAGTLDPSYGSTGYVLDPAYSQGHALALGPTGVVYVCGVREQSGADLPTVWAFDAQGAPVTGFGTAGIFSLPAPPDATGAGTCLDLVVTSSGLLYLTGGFETATAADPLRQHGFVARLR
jgi:uncharacterized delta-60 repeat protein